MGQVAKDLCGKAATVQDGFSPIPARRVILDDQSSYKRGGREQGRSTSPVQSQVSSERVSSELELGEVSVEATLKPATVSC